MKMDMWDPWICGTHVGYVGNDVVEKDVFFDCVTPALTAYLGASPKKLLEPGRQR